MNVRSNQKNDLSLLDINFLEKHFLRDAQLLQEVLENFKKSCQHALSEMRVNTTHNQEIALANSTHKLKSAALNFMQNGLIKRLAEIEQQARMEKLIPVTVDEIDQIEFEIQSIMVQLTHLVDVWRE